MARSKTKGGADASAASGSSVASASPQSKSAATAQTTRNSTSTRNSSSNSSLKLTPKPKPKPKPKSTRKAASGAKPAPACGPGGGRRKVGVKNVDLALQGGGAHGAFTWGVLDRFLADGAIHVEGISGTSAGAMNGAIMAAGIAEGGHDCAREKLAQFWRAVSDAARFSPLQSSPLDVLLGRWSLDHSPAFAIMDMTARVFSPYDLNPAGGNPLSDILRNMIDFEVLNRCGTKLFVTATNVETGVGKVFRNPDITVDVLLASACLPMLYHAVEIDGVPYWDGGYSGNPSIGPLVRECGSADTILVQINPIHRPGIPKSAREIANRLNEVSFNSTLIKELRMIALLRQILPEGHAEGKRWAEMRMHNVSSDIMLELDYSSKMNASWDFISMLHDKGYAAAEAFLRDHRDDIGVRPTVDIDRFAPDVC